VFSGALLKSALVVGLTARFGVRGAAAGIAAGFVLSAALNVWAVGRLTGCRPPLLGWAAAGLPALVAQGMCTSLAWGGLPALPLGLRLVAAAAAGSLAYGVCFVGVWRLLRPRLGLPARLPVGMAHGGATV